MPKQNEVSFLEMGLVFSVFAVYSVMFARTITILTNYQIPVWVTKTAPVMNAPMFLGFICGSGVVILWFGWVVPWLRH